MNFSDASSGTVHLGDLKELELEIRPSPCAGSSLVFPTASCLNKTLKKLQIIKEIPSFSLSSGML